MDGAFGVFFLNVFEAAEHDPVADGGKIASNGAGVAHFAGDFGPDVPGGGVNEVGFLVLLDDARSGRGGFAGL